MRPRSTWGRWPRRLIDGRDEVPPRQSLVMMSRRLHCWLIGRADTIIRHLLLYNLCFDDIILLGTFGRCRRRRWKLHHSSLLSLALAHHPLEPLFVPHVTSYTCASYNPHVLHIPHSAVLIRDHHEHRSKCLVFITFARNAHMHTCCVCEGSSTSLSCYAKCITTSSNLPTSPHRLLN